MRGGITSRKMYREVEMGVPEGRIVIIGSGPLSRVRIREVPSTLELTLEQKSFIPQAVRRLEAEGRVVSDGPTYRLESWASGEELLLRVSRRSYFDSVLLKQHVDWGVRSRVLAVACVLKCADGYLIERRSEKVAAMPGRLHLSPSGSLIPPQHPKDTLLQEAAEELGLEEHELQDRGCLGLVYGESVGVFQLVLTATVHVTRDEISRRECTGAWERSGLLCAPADPELLPRWLSGHRLELTEAARSALVMEGIRHWGEEWGRTLLLS